MSRYAEVLLPLPIYGSFTYRIPEAMSEQLRIGSRVLVQFGRKKCYTGIVVAFHDTTPSDFEVKELLDILDPYPIVRRPQLQLWQWIAEYYLCTPGEVFKAAVPAGLKVESETYVQANPDYEVTAETKLRERELIALDTLATRGRMKVGELQRLTGFASVEAIVMRLLEDDAIFVSENVVNSYRPKTETYVTLCCDRTDEASLHDYFDRVRIARKQEQMLLTFLELSHWLRQGELLEVTKKELIERTALSAATLTALQQKGIMRAYRKEMNRFAATSRLVSDPPKLTDVQQRALWEIYDSMKAKPVTLLRGVTGSGKTEIYINLIVEMLRHRKQVLYLVPEIALTTQLTQRLQRVLGDTLLIYHSRFSDNERVDIWRRLLRSDEPMVVLGVRSSVFLPFGNLGLVIIDEEHDSSFKQFDPAPRYNARSVGIMLAQMHGAKTLLGSATPSIESFHNALTGKYGLVELTERFEGIEMPEVEIIDIKEARKRKEMNGLMSDTLTAYCRKALADGKQIILFQNRRGYAPRIECSQCGWIPKCPNCDVSLTYHKYTDTLTCHYCGHTIMPPKLCPACGQASLRIVGYGTERIEDDIEALLPDATTLRMDLDTTRNKNSYDRIIDDFSSGKAQILVGTQMVTKGLDFGGVQIVGVLNADTLLHFPDFRAVERSFNQLEQVAGRAGRKGKQGRVVIQTSSPTHPVFDFVKRHDYRAYFDAELDERRRYGYPPFTKIINIYLKHRDDTAVTEVSVRYTNLLHQVFGQRVMGPEAPLVARIQQLHIRQIVLKMENAASMRKVKNILRQCYEQLLQLDSRAKSTILYYDVDPA